MNRVALYTCPVLTSPGGEGTFAALDGAIERELREAPPPGLLEIVRLGPPRRWPAHVAAAGGSPKPTLSIWQGLADAFAYSYGPGLHRQALRQRRQWFASLAGPVYVLWYVTENQGEEHDAAVERMERLAAGGPSPLAFDFRQPYGPDGLPVDPAAFRALRQDEVAGGHVGPVPLPLRDPAGHIVVPSDIRATRVHWTGGDAPSGADTRDEACG